METSSPQLALLFRVSILSFKGNFDAPALKSGTCLSSENAQPSLHENHPRLAGSCVFRLRQSPARFATELKLATCVKWYELGRVSQAKAAEIAGISRAAFIDALREYNVPAIQVAPSALEKELGL